MYTPTSFRETNRDVLHELMRRYDFATLFSWTPEGPRATHLPFVLDAARGPHGTLIAHMARANPHWRSFAEGRESLVAFVGPHAYISPSWYARPAAVPTWNYAAVHVYGIPRVVEDAATLRSQVLALTAVHESAVGSAWDPRHIEDDLPKLLKALVGFEIPIDRIEGKFKFNQNRSPEDRAGVVAALEAETDPGIREVASIMRRGLEQGRDG